MEKPRFRPVKRYGRKRNKPAIKYGVLDERTCKTLYLSGRIDDTWDIEIHIPDEDTLYEKPGVLWNR